VLGKLRSMITNAAAVSRGGTNEQPGGAAGTRLAVLHMAFVRFTGYVDGLSRRIRLDGIFGCIPGTGSFA